MYHFLRSKKGFTLTEIFTCIIILGILCAVGVPLYTGVSKKHKIQECDNNCQMISTVIQEVMYGMVDNGKKQEYFIKGAESDWMSCNAPNNYMFFLSDNKADCQKSCVIYFKHFNLSGPGDRYWQIASLVSRNRISSLGSEFTVNGKYYKNNYWCSEISDDEFYGLRIGDIRGGYRPDTYKDYNDGCDHGYFLKKKALADRFLTEYLANAEVPVCPFDKDGIYHYYVFADGTVLCSCPDCVNAHNS